MLNLYVLYICIRINRKTIIYKLQIKIEIYNKINYLFSVASGKIVLYIHYFLIYIIYITKTNKNKHYIYINVYIFFYNLDGVGKRYFQFSI